MNDPYRDPSLPVDRRVEDLLDRMTLPEKVGQMLQLDARGDLKGIVADKLAGSILHASPRRLLEAIELAAGTRLGIPLLTADDCIHGHSFWPGATIFPTQLAMAATWDADLLERVARATAVEVAATGINWTFSPVLCIARDLRWGRIDETFGEDPYLIGELGAAMVRGYQGGGMTDPTAILATAKHFAGYSETQGGRDASEADLSPRKLRSRALVPPGWQVRYARGADIERLVPDPEGAHYPDGQPRPPISQGAPVDEAKIAEAVAAARAADVAVVVVGDTVALTGETKSTATLELQGGQVALLDAVAATGTPTVVVLINSKPAVLPPSALGAAALIQAFNPGMRGGRAIAELVLGLIEPSGRLPISAARHVGQQPVYYNQVRGQHGSRYADLTQHPQFVFGEGLSYTTVEYAGLAVAAPDVPAGGTVRASVRLTNTGSRPALETVQAYVSDLVTSVTWAEQELKGYRQVTVPAGGSMTVELAISAADCTLVTADGRRVVEPGEFELRVGPNSRDLIGARFRITG